MKIEKDIILYKNYVRENNFLKELPILEISMKTKQQL